MPNQDLLSDKNKCCWGAPQKEAFQRLKSELSSTRVLASWSPTAETCVAADASSYGLRPVPNNSWVEAEHCTQIEKEALAVTWVCKQLFPYHQGLRFKLGTDHKPLLPLFSTKALDELPPRILRFKQTDVHF